MECPRCKIELHKKTIQEIEVDECQKCEGIWFEKDELRQQASTTLLLDFSGVRKALHYRKSFNL